jgi:hypothetical protein
MTVAPTKKTTAKKAPAVKAAANTTTVKDIEAMSKVERIQAVKAENVAKKAAIKAGKPVPPTPVSDWYAKTPAEERKATKAASTGGTRLVTDAERQKAVEGYVANGCTSSAQVAKAMRADGIPCGFWLTPMFKKVTGAAKDKTATPPAKKAAKRATPPKPPATKAVVKKAAAPTGGKKAPTTMVRTGTTQVTPRPKASVQGTKVA